MDVMHRTVCEYLLKSSGSSNLTSLSDEEFKVKMRAFGEQNPDNPAVVWLGYSPKIRTPTVNWQRVSPIDVASIISRGLNPAWQPVLESVGHSFMRFVKECHETYGNEYRQEIPPEGLSLIIGISHPENPAEIELLDGSHRLAGMILLDRIAAVGGYIGNY